MRLKIFLILIFYMLVITLIGNSLAIELVGGMDESVELVSPEFSLSYANSLFTFFISMMTFAIVGIPPAVNLFFFVFPVIAIFVIIIEYVAEAI